MLSLSGFATRVTLRRAKMKILVMVVLELDALDREEHSCQIQKDSEGAVPAYVQSSAFGSQVGESSRSPDPGRMMR